MLTIHAVRVNIRHRALAEELAQHLRLVKQLGLHTVAAALTYEQS
jgi:hypothetical protein